jgi:chromosome segregation ATPase
MLLKEAPQMSELNFAEESTATKLEEPITRQTTKTLGLSMDEFSALEERVLRAVTLVRRERQARAAAEERANELEAKLNARNPELDHLHEELTNKATELTQKSEEITALNAERGQLRERVERILAQLDSLEL